MGRREVPSTPGALAFLVHSQETVANKMPPDVDNKALARQRRRRTRYVLNFYLPILTRLIRLSCDAFLGGAMRPARARIDPPR
jgi:hypothetical protein